MLVSGVKTELWPIGALFIVDFATWFYFYIQGVYGKLKLIVYKMI